ncbi:hypothetical protein B0T20DRAFT_392358 [Sordaria brevicollis]|uniref:Uncharacterized protein n=1 Tax=Sordaria brevicollis TaxID=83679 RepID=A0AAE0PG68_SORBR|nr:hypothetical protein B0T20DRAFT_392358 [Sordaria brevicollis]
MPQTNQSTTTRRVRTARSDRQTPTLQRQDATVIYENVNGVDLSIPAEELLGLSNSNHEGQRRTINTPAPASGSHQAAPPRNHSRSYMNSRRIESEPQLPVYTENPGAHEMTMEVTPAEKLPTYEQVQASNGESSNGRPKVIHGEGMFIICIQFHASQVEDFS